MRTWVVETAQIARDGRAPSERNEAIETCRARARGEVSRLCAARGWTLVRAVSEETREAPDYARSCGVPLLVTIQWEIAA